MYQVPLNTYEALTRVQRGQGLFSCTLFARTAESVWAFSIRNRKLPLPSARTFQTESWAEHPDPESLNLTPPTSRRNARFGHWRHPRLQAEPHPSRY